METQSQTLPVSGNYTPLRPAFENTLPMSYFPSMTPNIGAFAASRRVLNAVDLTLHNFDEFDLTLHDFNEFDLTLHDFNEFDLTLHDFDEFDSTWP